MKNVFIIFLLLLFATSCSHMSVLNIKSNPKDANVYARSLGSTGEVLIGKTPLEINSEDIQKKLNTKGLLVITIKKDQHYVEEFYLSDYSNRDIAISYNLRQLPQIDQAAKVDTIVAELFACQKLVRVHRFSDCLKILANLKKSYPEVSTIHEFEGSIFYLKEEKNKALQSFTTALRYNPKNNEARRMINIIKDDE